MNRLDARTWITIIVTVVVTAAGVAVLFWFLGDDPGVGMAPLLLAVGIAAMVGGLVVGIILEATRRGAGTTATDEPSEVSGPE